MFPDLRISSSPKNFNSEIGLVLAIFEETSFSPGIGAIGTLLRIMRKALVESPAYDVILLEYGIDHPGDMTYLTSIVQPHMGIFTGLDKVHAAYFSSIDELLAEKMVLLEKTKETIYVPVHAHYVDSFLTDFSGDILTYTLEPDLQADIGYHEYRLVADP
jgi:UDP-N-acetylmuramyl pentapeptide synthase